MENNALVLPNRALIHSLCLLCLHSVPAVYIVPTAVHESLIILHESLTVTRAVLLLHESLSLTYAIITLQ